MSIYILKGTRTPSIKSKLPVRRTAWGKKTEIILAKAGEMEIHHVRIYALTIFLEFNSSPPLPLNIAVNNDCITKEMKVLIPKTNAKQSLGMFFAISALNKNTD